MSRKLLSLLFVMLFLGVTASASAEGGITFIGGGGGGNGTFSGSSSIYKLNNVTGPGPSAQRKISWTGKLSKSSLEAVCLRAVSLSNPCTRTVTGPAVKEFENKTDWFNPGCAGWEKNRGEKNDGQGPSAEENPIECSGYETSSPPPGLPHGESPSNSTDIGARRVVALNVRIWRYSPEGCSPACPHPEEPILDRTVATTTAGWWRSNPFDNSAGAFEAGPFYNSSSPNGVQFTTALRDRQHWSATEGCLEPQHIENHPCHDPIYVGAGSEKIVLHWRLSGTGDGANSFHYQITGPPHTVYAIQVVGLDNRNTVIFQQHSLYLSNFKIHVHPEITSCTGPCCNPATCPPSHPEPEFASGEAPTLVPSLIGLHTVVAGQEDLIHAEVGYEESSTALGGTVPRNVTAYFSRGTEDPNKNNDIELDHTFNGTPYDEQEPSPGGATTMAMFNLFTVHGWSPEPNELLSDLYHYGSEESNWEAMFSEVPKSSTPQEQSSGNVNNPGPTEPEQVAKDEQETAEITYEERWVTGVNTTEKCSGFNTDSITPYSPANGGGWPQGYKIPAGYDASSVIPLDIYHYQACPGKADFALTDTPTNAVAENIAWTGIVDRDSFPNFGEGNYKEVARGSTLNVCRKGQEDEVYLYDYQQHYRNYEEKYTTYYQSKRDYHPLMWEWYKNYDTGSGVHRVHHHDLLATLPFYDGAPAGENEKVNAGYAPSKVSGGAANPLVDFEQVNGVPAHWDNDWTKEAGDHNHHWYVFQNTSWPSGYVTLANRAYWEAAFPKFNSANGYGYDPSPWVHDERVSITPRFLPAGHQQSPEAPAEGVPAHFSVAAEDAGDWKVNYPAGAENLMYNINEIPDYHYKPSTYVYNNMNHGGGWNHNEPLTHETVPSVGEEREELDPSYEGQEVNVPAQWSPTTTEGYDYAFRVGGSGNKIYENWGNEYTPPNGSPTNVGTAPNTPSPSNSIPSGWVGWDKNNCDWYHPANGYFYTERGSADISWRVEKIPAPADYYVAFFYDPGVDGHAPPPTTSYWGATVEYWKPPSLSYGDCLAVIGTNGIGGTCPTLKVGPNFLRVYNSRATG